MLETITNEYEGIYNSFYKRIKNEVDGIKSKFEYEKKSQAFAHWYLFNVEGINENIVEECITDGHNDWGIDAVIIDTKADKVNIYQFKFPDKEENISKKITQEDIASFLRGYKICSSGKAPLNANEDLRLKVAEIDESDIFSFKLTFVSYTDNLSDTAKITLDDELEKIKGTGNILEWVVLDKKDITSIIYEKGKLLEDYTIVLSQHGTSTGVLMEEDSTTYTIHASLFELAELCKNYQSVLFDENVRLFHGVENKFNKGIISTASGSDVNHFHLYNNGIVIVSPEVNNGDFKKIIKIKNPMVVNGCQTMNSLLEAKNRGILQDGLVQVTIIDIKDPIIKQNISIYLNSQTEIKDSYLISNLPIIRTLEEDLKNLGYFFERQANNLDLLKKRLSRKEKTQLLGVNNSKAIELDLAIQLQASFYENLAPTAKLNKAKLFEQKNLELILKNINADRVAFAFEIYNKMMERISEYRSYKRNKKNKNILNYLNIKEKDINNYSFLNTGDFFLISTFSIISQKKYGKLPAIGEKRKMDFASWSDQVIAAFDEIFKESVDIMLESIIEDSSSKQIATLTKSVAFYKVLIQKVNTRYEDVTSK